jgi:hypothetical protein
LIKDRAASLMVEAVHSESIAMAEFSHLYEPSIFEHNIFSFDQVIIQDTLGLPLVPIV